MRIGYKASAEQFGPRELLELRSKPRRVALTWWRSWTIFSPGVITGGHGPSALTWLGAAGQATSAVTLGTSVLTPTLRYQPPVVAQAFGTLGVLNLAVCSWAWAVGRR